ncbi:hypothetical protein PIB30_104872, partial [Stylosanthes scabra]|nr:hypothetical protein [Stylosanthes scabra]
GEDHVLVLGWGMEKGHHVVDLANAKSNVGRYGAMESHVWLIWRGGGRGHIVTALGVRNREGLGLGKGEGRHGLFGARSRCRFGHGWLGKGLAHVSATFLRGQNVA